MGCWQALLFELVHITSTSRARPGDSLHGGRRDDLGGGDDVKTHG